MAFARVVKFDGITSDRMAQMQQEMEGSGPPEGMPSAEFMMLHDPANDKALAIIIVDSEEDYAKAHEILDAMPASETPGNRVSVTKYSVAARMSA